MNKEYLISEEDIKLIQVQGWDFRRLIKSKKPIKIIAEGEITASEYGIYINHIPVTFDDLVEGYLGKKGKLVWGEK